MASVEVVLLALLLPALCGGAVAVLRAGFSVAWPVLSYGLLIWFVLALVVVNEGSLFRLRLQGVLPVVVVALGAGGLGVYGRVFARVGFGRARLPGRAS